MHADIQNGSYWQKASWEKLHGRLSDLAISKLTGLQELPLFLFLGDE